MKYLHVNADDGADDGAADCALEVRMDGTEAAVHLSCTYPLQLCAETMYMLSSSCIVRLAQTLGNFCVTLRPPGALETCLILANHNWCH